jgi:glycosyltransferase involved in cell wall biosynthesis
MPPQVSVIIPTYNGAHKVQNCLQSLEKQSFRNFEVIVVIDGSLDNTEITLKNKVFKLPSLQVLVQANKGRSGARNAGVAVAAGKILLFVDDDMRLSADALAQHVRFHECQADALLMGAAFEEEALMQTDLQRYRAALSRKWSAPFAQAQALSKEHFFLMAAHLSMPKKLLEALGAFDEALRDAEDYDLGKRALEAGYRIYFDTSILAWHDDFITCRSYIKRQQQYFRAHQRLKDLYPVRYADNFYEAKPPQSWKKQVYRLLSLDLWPWLIDHCNFFRFLPKKIRYKYYDAVITAHTLLGKGGIFS